MTSVSFAATSQSSQNQQQQARLDFNTPDFVVKGTWRRTLSRLVFLHDVDLVQVIHCSFICLLVCDVASEEFFHDSPFSFPSSETFRLVSTMRNALLNQVGTRNAYIVHLESALFDEVEPSARRGALIVQGMPDEVHGVAMHPHKAQLAIACYNGAVYLWDLDTKVITTTVNTNILKIWNTCLSYT